MKKAVEMTYGNTMRGLMFAVNPIKKIVIKTHCYVHKYLNRKALDVLKLQGYKEQYNFFTKYLNAMNDGTFWADQDFKSSNHFYHYIEGKGLYGFSNALQECKKYHNRALRYAEQGNMDKALFYFGAACHLVQDSTVPHHVNNKLLKGHRDFELWIGQKVASGRYYKDAIKVRRYPSVDEYIKKNALMANKIYDQYDNISSKEMRYSKISREILRQAEMTTAGFMLDFYEAILANHQVGSST
ncbi:MAG: zinc dependent phospholipase C family protein [Bacillota bacterium]|nr:zinc dependent phospholipase C family protein [Bacillota bacterium]